MKKIRRKRDVTKDIYNIAVRHIKRMVYCQYT